MADSGHLHHYCWMNGRHQGSKMGFTKKKKNPEIWNDCNEGYFRNGALFVFNEHLPVRCSSGHTAEWMASLWECRSFKQPLVNTLRLCPLWTRQQQTEPLFWSFQREKNCTVVLKPQLLYFILSFTCATAARETMMKVNIAVKLLELVQSLQWAYTLLGLLRKNNPTSKY